MRALIFSTVLLTAAGCVQTPNQNIPKETAADSKSTSVAFLDYPERIRLKVRKFTLISSDTPPDAEVVVDLHVLPDGTILKMEQIKSTGFKPYEQAVARALRLAEPLPVPKDYETFQKYRYLRLVFRPETEDTK